MDYKASFRIHEVNKLQNPQWWMISMMNLLKIDPQILTIPLPRNREHLRHPSLLPALTVASQALLAQDATTGRDDEAAAFAVVVPPMPDTEAVVIADSVATAVPIHLAMPGNTQRTRTSRIISELNPGCRWPFK
jgi:hypothetical protein